MTNVTMLLHNRPRLAKQSLDSLADSQGHSPMNVMLYDDASDSETAVIAADWTELHGQCLRGTVKSEGTGKARNAVIKASEEAFGRGDYLYLSDSDVFFYPNWLETMIECYEEAWKHGFKVLGAYNHPYHQPIASIRVSETHAVHEVYALALQSMLMRWEVWDAYGPFDITPVGRVRMSEDVAFTNKLREDGGRVGVVAPALLVNTGISDSFGQKIPGWEIVEAQCPAGVYCE